MRRFRRAAALLSGLALTACATGYAPQASNADAYADLLVGRVADLQRDYAAASDRYVEALTREPHSATLIDGAVTTSLASGDIARARNAARMASSVDAPDYARLVRAVDQIAAGRTRQAADELNRINGGAIPELQKRMLLVWTQAADGHVDDAVGALAPLASIRPYGSLFSYQQAMALDLVGRNDEALDAYRAASGAGMFLPPAAARHADLLARTGARDDALELLRSDANANNPELAVAAVRLQADAPIAARLTPARGAAIGLYGLAAIFEQENDPTHALATLSLARMLDPQLDAARLMFAQIQSQLDHPQLAEAALRGIPATSPYAVSAQLLQARLLLEQGSEDEALALAGEAAAGGDLRARRQLGDMYRNLGRYEQAEPVYSQLIAASPNDWRLYFARGATRERLHRWEDAEADFRHALVLSPEQPDVLNYLGYSWIDRGENLQEGLAMLQRAAALRPNSGAVLDSLGWAYFRLGDYGEAVQYLEAAVQFEPADPTLNDHLGDVYWRLDRRIEARFQWQRALGFEPDDPAPIQAKLENGLPPAPPPQSATR